MGMHLTLVRAAPGACYTYLDERLGVHVFDHPLFGLTETEALAEASQNSRMIPTDTTPSIASHRTAQPVPHYAAPAGMLVSLPHWHEAEFIAAMVDGTPFPHELTITTQNEALASIVHAVLARRGYTITRDMVDPLTVHARTMLPSSPLP